MDNKSNIVSGVFESRSDAESAISELRQMGIQDSWMSIIAQDDKNHTTTSDASGQTTEDHDNTGSGFAKGATVGAGVGALFGLAALAIPGIGPFIAAGALANAFGAAGGAVAAGAIVGGTAGALSGALMKYGVDETDAKYYEKRITSGGVFVAVDTQHSQGINRDQIWNVFQRYNATTGSKQLAS